MIKVVRISGDNMMCLCPLHPDENASLSINVKKMVAFCFAGCYSGKLVPFISQVEGLPENIAWRKIVGNEIFEYDFSYQGRGKKPKQYAIPANGITWGPGDTTDYLLNRGFSRDTLFRWNIEFSSDIMHIRIPVCDSSGNLICYSYRTIDPDVEPKYIHPGFPKKSGILFGEHMRIGVYNMYVNVVEGGLDCVWLWQNGFENTVAFLGTPSDEQINKIIELGGKFRLCLDNDEAGKKVTETLREFFERNGAKVVSIQIPKGFKDVQELDTDTLKSIMMLAK